MKSIGIFDLLPGIRETDFQIIPKNEIENENHIEGVFSLGQCVYKEKCYFFFGSMGFSSLYKERASTNQIIEFDLQRKRWEVKHPFHKPEKFFSGRSHVASLIIDKFYLCLGGINKYGFALDEMVMIDMDTFQWKRMELQKKKSGPGHVFSCAMCLVAYQEREQLKLDHFSEVKWDLVTQKINLEGIFVFGGVKGEKPNYDTYDDNLYRLSIGPR